jgi:hypothetical protein
MLFLSICLLSMSLAAAQTNIDHPNIGAIRGVVTDKDGLPAKRLTLNAEPLGVVLGMALPWTKTNDAGAFRFEHLPLGTYIVFAEDKEEGYSSFATGPGGDHPPNVELTTEHPEVEFNFRIPPKAGFLFFHLTNQKTGAPISGVEVTVMLALTPLKTIFGGGQSSTQAVLVPSNENLLLHVKSWGFREWEKSVGDGKPIRIAPGDHLTLDVQLEPANPLTARLPDADPKKYLGIQDEKDWMNPYLIVRADGIEIAGTASSGRPIPVEFSCRGIGALTGFRVAIRVGGRSTRERRRSAGSRAIEN